MYFESPQHMIDHAKSLGCNMLVNCTGMGASKLCNDDNLQRGRGVTLHFDRRTVQRRLTNKRDGGSSSDEPSLDAVLATNDPPFAPNDDFPCYLIPRGDVLVVGGSFLVGDDEPGI